MCFYYTMMHRPYTLLLFEHPCVSMPKVVQGSTAILGIAWNVRLAAELVMAVCDVGGPKITHLPPEFSFQNPPDDEHVSTFTFDLSPIVREISNSAFPRVLPPSPETSYPRKLLTRPLNKSHIFAELTRDFTPISSPTSA